MISAVRNVSFGESAQDLINAEGKYSAQPKLEDMPSDSFESKKSNKAATAAAVSVVGLAAAALGLGYAASKNKLGDLKQIPLEGIEGTWAKLSARAKNLGKTIAESCQKMYEKLAGLFSKSEKVAPKAEEAAE